jgi:drug/metabolite transporter (DMT)-like permease
MLLISANDVIVKLASSSMGVGQLLFVRGLLACVIFSLAIVASGRPLVPHRGYSGWNLLRAACETAATLCFVTALTLLPIAIVATLVWTSPLFLTLMAIMFLGERVSVNRWVALVFGFVGMVLVTNPFAGDFSPTLLLPLAAALFVAIRDVTTRKVDVNLHSMYITMPTLAMVTLIGLMLSINTWQPMTVVSVSWLSLSAALLSAGFFAQIVAIRGGELSFVSPFAYIGVISAVFWGVLIWQEVPSVSGVIGMLMIVCSSVFIIFRQSSR